LGVSRGASAGTVKLSPTVRSTPMAQAIPTIPLEAINSFLFNNRIVNNEQEFAAAPYVLAGAGESVVMGAGQSIYARGAFTEQQPSYGIYRQGRTYTDPVSKEFLGINANVIGNAEASSVEGDITTLKLTRSNEEVRIGDRLFPTDERAVNSTFTPSEPAKQIDGVIIDVPRGVNRIGSMDVVTINKGTRDGLVEGNVLAIMKTGEMVRDRITGESVQVPASRGGLLMVFRTFDKISYGLVLTASRDLALQDRVVNP
jgi:nucleoid-associated protein YgaU